MGVCWTSPDPQTGRLGAQGQMARRADGQHLRETGPSEQDKYLSQNSDSSLISFIDIIFVDF